MSEHTCCWHDVVEMDEARGAFVRTQTCCHCGTVKREIWARRADPQHGPHQPTSAHRWAFEPLRETETQKQTNGATEVKPRPWKDWL